MTLLTWNVRLGGGARVARIVEEIAAHDPDVIALTAYRAAPGKELRAAFAERGWTFFESTVPNENERGIAVFARTPLRALPCPAAPEHRDRRLDVALPEYGFGLSVLYIMAAGSSKLHPLSLAKARFWDDVVQGASARLGEPWIMTGMWNTGAQRVDETGKTFVCSEQFRKLSELGWTDLWRHHNPTMTEWTWYSTRKGGVRGNGFRLDHAFATPSLLPRVASCRYSHRERDARVSDHSIVMVEIAAA
jgi:exodeoxyribonuclease III